MTETVWTQTLVPHPPALFGAGGDRGVRSEDEPGKRLWEREGTCFQFYFYFSQSYSVIYWQILTVIFSGHGFACESNSWAIYSSLSWLTISFILFSPRSSWGRQTSLTHHRALSKKWASRDMQVRFHQMGISILEGSSLWQLSPISSFSHRHLSLAPHSTILALKLQICSWQGSSLPPLVRSQELPDFLFVGISTYCSSKDIFHIFL